MRCCLALLLLLLIACSAPVIRADSNDDAGGETTTTDDDAGAKTEDVKKADDDAGPSKYKQPDYEEIDIDLPIVSDAAFHAVNQSFPWDAMPYEILNAQRMPYVQGQMKYYLVIRLEARPYVRQCQITEYFIRHVPTYGLEWYVDKYGAISGCPGVKIINNWIG